MTTIFRRATLRLLPLLILLSSPLSAQMVFESSIDELQELLANGEATSVQLVEAYLTRIAAFDRQGPGLAAMLWINPDARGDAQRLDRERQERGPRGPLHGIPVVIKDNMDVAGAATSGGSVALSDHVVAGDAHQVRLLREAGAVILGKTNLHELAYGITSVSSLGGQTRNPYLPTRNPGGSSGGTAAAVTASFAAIGWGSDTCGSIRIPAAANNLFGLRPTKGLSSISGVMPLSSGQDVAGPLARTVRDLAIGLDATVGPDPRDPATSEPGARGAEFLAALDAAALRGVRIGILRPLFGSGLEEMETTRIVEQALARMADLGAELVEVDPAELQELLGGTSLIEHQFKWDLMDYLAMTPDARVRSLREILEMEVHHPAVDAALRRSDRSERRLTRELEEVMRRRAELSRWLDDWMNVSGLHALAYPVLRREVAAIGEPALGNNCQLSAATGAPAIAIPAGFAVSGVPVGLELLGRRFEDAKLVAFAYAFEQAFQPRRPPATTPDLSDAGP